MQRYAITDRRLLPASPDGWEAALCVQVAQWASEGVEWVQLREKDLPAEELARLLRTLAAIVHKRGSKTRLLVNGLTPQAAIASGADGVHLPGGASVHAVQAAVSVARVVTASCHTLDEILAARAGGAAAALWAPVFSKVSGQVEVLPGTGLAALEAACRAATPMPVFALGGVTAANAGECRLAGAAGVAGIRLFLGSDFQSAPLPAS